MEKTELELKSAKENEETLIELSKVLTQVRNTVSFNVDSCGTNKLIDAVNQVRKLLNEKSRSNTPQFSFLIDKSNTEDNQYNNNNFQSIMDQQFNNDNNFLSKGLRNNVFTSFNQPGANEVNFQEKETKPFAFKTGETKKFPNQSFKVETGNNTGTSKPQVSKNQGKKMETKNLKTSSEGKGDGDDDPKKDNNKSNINNQPKKDSKDKSPKKPDKAQAKKSNDSSESEEEDEDEDDDTDSSSDSSSDTGSEVSSDTKKACKVISHMVSNKKPLKLDSNTPSYSAAKNEKLDDWIYIIKNNFKTGIIKTNKEKLAVIANYVKGPVLTTHKRYTVDSEKPTWKGFCNLLRKLYEPKNQILRLRAQLKNLKMTESVMKYSRRFQELVNLIPGITKEEELTYFIDGLTDKYQFEVLNKECKTLNEAMEITSNLDFCMKRHDVEVNQVKRINNLNFQKRNFSNNKPQFKNYFAKTNPMGNQNFKKDLSKVKCYTCNKLGHYSKTCRNNKQNNSGNKFGQQRDNQRYKIKTNPHKIMSISSNGSVESLLCVNGKINGISMKLYLDSGATASIMSYDTAKQNNYKILPSNIKVKVADNMIIDVMGVTEPVTIDVQGHSCTLELYIMEHDDHEVLLGLNWFMATGAGIFPGEGILRFKGESVYLENQVKVYDNEPDELVMMSEIANAVDEEDIEGETDWTMIDQDQVLKTMVPIEKLEKDQIKKFHELRAFVKERFAFDYKDLGTCKLLKHKIRTSNDDVIFLYPYRKSMKEREEIQAEILKMLEAGIIRPSNSAWSSPVLIIPKKDGSKRMCVDYRKVNAITIQENWPLPDIRDILDRVNGSCWFTALDLKSGYWQILMDELSIAITAFSTPDGHYEFLRLPFGLKNAPSFFSRIMHQILGEFKFVEIYLDDITIHSKTFDEHIEHIKIVFRALKKANLKVNSTKCTWCAKSIKILGHIVSKDNVAMDPAKIQAIKERLPPNNIKQVQQYLGICNYYRRFIKDFSKIARPLFQLLTKESKWNWTPECQDTFEQLKAKLIWYPILRHLDYSKPFLLHTVISNRW